MTTEASTETDKTPLHPTDWLKWLGERRDGFLIGGAVLYGLGYLVWSYNAWRNQLGQLPAIEFQYLMSGLIPGAILALAWIAIIFFSRMRVKALALIEKKPRLRWVGPSILIMLSLTLTLGTVAISEEWLRIGLTERQVSNYIGPVFMVVFYFAILTSGKSQRRSSSNLFDWMLSVQKYYVACAFCWFSLVIYFDLYPHLPQELGGPRPRCAYIDLVREDIAPVTFAVLVPKPSPDGPKGSEPKVVRSNKLNVYFASSDYLLVRAASDTKDDSSAALKRTPLYELRREVIRVVEWCPE